MSVNKHQNHVLVLPEDDANRQIAHGFQLHPSIAQRAIQVLPPPGGWPRVRDEFSKIHVANMDRIPLRHMVLLVDFDERDNRLDVMKAVIPQMLADRVFVVGVWSEPERLRTAKGCSFEDVGFELAQDCRDGSRTGWNHPLLRHNSSEVDRMTERLSPFLFPA
jgi:hypothetical protein